MDQEHFLIFDNQDYHKQTSLFTDWTEIVSESEDEFDYTETAPIENVHAPFAGEDITEENTSEVTCDTQNYAQTAIKKPMHKAVEVITIDSDDDDRKRQKMRSMRYTEDTGKTKALSITHDPLEKQTAKRNFEATSKNLSKQK